MKQLLFLIFLLYFNTLINAKEPFKFDKEKVVYFGNVGMQFGTYTLINFSPTIGYKFTDKFTAGLGPMVNYISNRFSNYSNFSYGARAYGKYYVIENAYLTGDYQLINNNWLGNNVRSWLDFPLVGAGYRQNIGGNVFLDFQVLWNLNNSTNYYSNPIIRGGISIR